jgi:hypothetical protein
MTKISHVTAMFIVHLNHANNALQYEGAKLEAHSGDHEELYLLGYNTVECVEIQLTFRRNLPSSSESKTKALGPLTRPAASG